MNQPSALADKAMLLGKEASEHLKIPPSLCLETEQSHRRTSDQSDCRLLRRELARVLDDDASARGTTSTRKDCAS